MVDKDTRRSRRARRREEQDAENEQAAESADSADASGEEAESSTEEADSGEPDEEAGAEADASDEEAAEEAAADEEPAESKPSRPRTAQRKKKKKKKRSGSPDRIRDRNERIRERAAARRRARQEAQGLAAGEMVDDALARWAQKTTNWIKEHFNIVQWVVIVLVAGGIGWEIYSWRHTKTIEKASDKLITAVEDETARLPGDEASGQDAQFDPRKKFPTVKAREEAAVKSYEAAAAVAKGSGSSILATLGLAGVEYDQNKFAAAEKKYLLVKDSELAKHDTDVKGRAIEGIGMCLEAENKLDAAAKAYRELENMGVPGFTSLALYHEARVAYLQGKKDKAKQLLQKVDKKLAETDSPYPQRSYLATMSEQLMATINPGAAPAGGPRMQLTPAQIEKLREQIKKDPTKLKQLMKSMGLKLPAPAPAPAPAPEDTSTSASHGNPAPAPAPGKAAKGKSTAAPKKSTASKKPTPKPAKKPTPKPAKKPTPKPAPAGSAP